MVSKVNVMQSIDTVFFDWDFTLGAILPGASDGDRFSLLFHNAGLQQYGNSETISAAISKRQHDIKRGKLCGEIEPQTREQYTLYYQQILTILGYPDAPRQLVESLYEVWARLPFSLYEDTIPTFQVLVTHGILLGVITNHSLTIRTVIENLLGEFVLPKHIVISDEVGVYKPDGAIFTQAAARLGKPTKRCMYVGDDLTIDAVAAVTWGGYNRALWIDRSERGELENLPDNVYRITSLNETLEYVHRSI